MRKVTYEVLIVEELDDDTDSQERADKLAYEITAVLSDPITVEVTVIGSDVNTTIQMQQALIEDLIEERRQLLKERGQLLEEKIQLLEENVDLRRSLIEEIDYNIEQMRIEANLETILRGPVLKNSRLSIEN